MSGDQKGRMPAYSHKCAECGGQSRVIGKRLTVQHRENCALAARIAARYPHLAEPDSPGSNAGP